MDRTTALALLGRVTAPEPLDLAEMLEAIDSANAVLDSVETAVTRDLLLDLDVGDYSPRNVLARYDECQDDAARRLLVTGLAKVAHEAARAVDTVARCVGQDAGRVPSELRDQLDGAMRAA